MRLYPVEFREKIRSLRREGHTYTEIQNILGQRIPKGSLSYICKDIRLTPAQRERIYDLSRIMLVESRKKAVKANRKILEDKIAGYRKANLSLLEFMDSRHAKLVALAMLYLGEGAKWRGRRGLTLASSDPLITNLYINLLYECYEIPLSKLKAHVQHRADQDTEQLVGFWSKITGIKRENFYKSYVDRRTVGKVTRKPSYKGVCSISCGGAHIQLELEQIAGIISDALRGYGAVG